MSLATVPRPFLHYDVFTSTPLTGNQLAVFPDGRGLSDSEMQAIAREMNFSETTFVLPAEEPGTDVRMRIFTPGLELPMAGHPTIGTTFALAHTGGIAQGASRFVFGLNVGPTPVDLVWHDRGLAFAWMSQRQPQFGVPFTDRAAVASMLQLDVAKLHPVLPVQVISCGVPYVFVPLRDRAAVDSAVADVGAFHRVAGKDAVFIFAIAEAGREETVYSRMLAPQFGIPEDPATGGASGPLGCYLVQHGLVAGDQSQRILNLQGVRMHRPSRIHIAIDGTPGAITGVRVGGEAVLVARGELLVGSPVT